MMEKDKIIEKVSRLDSIETLMSLLSEIKADLVGSRDYPFTVDLFRKICAPEHHSYRRFSIPKKSGGSRTINAPMGSLKWMQICLNELFKAIYTPSEFAMGFADGKSVVSNARCHIGQEYVLNIDLSDFFPHITNTMIYRRLKQPPFNFNHAVADAVTRICTMEQWVYIHNEWEGRQSLPQGSPASPVLTNAVCDRLDQRLSNLARVFDLRYSRYADDISFSGSHNIFQAKGHFRKILNLIIYEEGFDINENKVRLQHRSQRQEVTGLTVNERPNVNRAWLKDIRATLHIWEKYGHDAAFMTFFPRYQASKYLFFQGTPSLENIIHGKLCYLKMVKGEDSPIYQRLLAQFIRVVKPPKPKPTDKLWVYHITMSYKTFVNRLGLEVKFANSQSSGRPYGFFFFHDTFQVIGVSRFINPGAIPEDAEISICSTTEGRHKETLKRRYLLLLHRRHDRRYPETGKIIREYYLSPSSSTKAESPKRETIKEEDLPPELRDAVNRLREFLPDLEITDFT